MTLLLQRTDPRPNRGDQKLSEQVEMIFADNTDYTTHEANVNAFLVSLRDDPNHVVAIRSIETQLDGTTAATNITALTTIHYLLIGTDDAPYIP